MKSFRKLKKTHKKLLKRKKQWRLRYLTWSLPVIVDQGGGGDAAGPALGLEGAHHPQQLRRLGRRRHC